MVGAVAAALRLCRPFLGSPAQQAAALAHLDPAYYRGQAHRLPGSPERALSGAMPQPLGPDEAPASIYLSPEGPGSSGGGAGASPPPPHFIAETFFLTQRLIHTGLMPTGVCVHVCVPVSRRTSCGEWITLQWLGLAYHLSHLPPACSVPHAGADQPAAQAV